MLTDTGREVRQMLNYMTGFTNELMDYILDPITNVPPRALDAQDLYDGDYTP